MSPRPSRSSAPCSSRMVRLIDLLRDAEGDARREVRLDHAGDHVDARPLRGEHDVHAGGARLLRETRDRRPRRPCPAASSGRRTRRPRSRCTAACRAADARRCRPWPPGTVTSAPSAVSASTSLRRRRRDLAGVHALHPGVVGGDVLRAGVGEQLVAPLHLVDGPAQRGRRLLHVGDDRQAACAECRRTARARRPSGRSSSRRSSSRRALERAGSRASR